MQSEGKGIKDSGGGVGCDDDDDDDGVEGGSDYDDNGDDDVGGWSVSLGGIAQHVISSLILKSFPSLKFLISGDLQREDLSQQSRGRQ